MSNKIKTIKTGIDKTFWVTLLLLTIVALSSFIGGFLIGKGSKKAVISEPVLIYGANTYTASDSAVYSSQNKPTAVSQINTINPTTASYFASKRGKKYYPISCLSGSKLKVENRIYFDSVDQAEKKGLTASDGC